MEDQFVLIVAVNLRDKTCHIENEEVHIALNFYFFKNAVCQGVQPVKEFLMRVNFAFVFFSDALDLSLIKEDLFKFVK